MRCSVSSGPSQQAMSWQGTPNTHLSNNNLFNVRAHRHHHPVQQSTAQQHPHNAALHCPPVWRVHLNMTRLERVTITKHCKGATHHPQPSSHTHMTGDGDASPSPAQEPEESAWTNLSGLGKSRSQHLQRVAPHLSITSHLSPWLAPAHQLTVVGLQLVYPLKQLLMHLVLHHSKHRDGQSGSQAGTLKQAGQGMQEAWVDSQHMWVSHDGGCQPPHLLLPHNRAQNTRPPHTLPPHHLCHRPTPPSPPLPPSGWRV